MKKFLAFAAAGVLCLSAAGCGGKDNKDDLVTETMKELEKAVEEDTTEDEGEEGAEGDAEAVIPEVALPDDIAAAGYDTGLIMTDTSYNFDDRMIYLPYSSDLYTFDDSIVTTIENDDIMIHAYVYDDADSFYSNIEAEKAGNGEEGKEVRELTIGEYNVVASTYEFFGWETDYYIDFNGKFGDIPGAQVNASTYAEDKEATRTADIEAMIANIFEAE